MRIDWAAVAKLGVPSVIACFLVWRLAEGFDMFDDRLKAIEHSQSQQQLNDQATKDIAARALLSSERILWVTQVMCANDASDASERERCLRER